MSHTESSAQPRAAASGDRRPSTVALALRPLGYLLLALLWTILWSITVLIPLGALAYLAFDDPQAVVATTHARLSSPGDAIGMALVFLPLVALVMGPAAIFHLPTMTWPLAVLNLVHAVRALRPSYARERLSFTTWQSRDESLGPPGFGPVALSFQPVRQSRFTLAVMRFYAAGWSLDGRMFRAMLPVGAAWAFAIVVVVPGFAPAEKLVCLVLTVALILASVVLGVRAFRARFWPREGRTRADGSEA
jgi:Na+-transporting methylmalonyl-CoA/oxaloacetate decarboxylase gamma subunit